MIIAISTGFGIQNEIKSKFSNVFGDLSIDRYRSEERRVGKECER